ncbi:winged helix-turn-helix domain-containing protein [Acidiphilium sp.]|uniref:helix-turn-helix domain-containing protein n=1 Tax=Acidiphilium sp. TaxID=527 RepID=UPI002584DB2A|nr:winged helix-turn-helix domain-containing protein [Acidiphilium sp.]
MRSKTAKKNYARSLKAPSFLPPKENRSLRHTLDRSHFLPGAGSVFVHAKCCLANNRRYGLYEGGACRLSDEQQERLKTWIAETLPRSTNQVGAWIAREFGIEYQGRSGLVALLHRLGMEHRKPKAISRKLDPVKQEAFINAYEDLLNHLPAPPLPILPPVPPLWILRNIGLVARRHAGWVLIPGSIRPGFRD